jgi:hypothetical protein
MICSFVLLQKNETACAKALAVAQKQDCQFFPRKNYDNKPHAKSRQTDDSDDK